MGTADAGVSYLHNDIDARPESEARRLSCPRASHAHGTRPGPHAPLSARDVLTRCWPGWQDEKQRCLENGWNVDDPGELQRWRDQEPINAHSHLAAMLLGSSECIPVCDGKIVLGQWQSVMLVDLDGPRQRTVGLQLVGFQ